jgi:hypothetical protein
MKRKTNYSVIIKRIGIILACVIHSNGLAIFKSKPSVPTETGKTASSGTPWNFDLYNKTKKPVYFSLHDQNDKSLISQMSVSPNGKVRAHVDNNGTLVIKIWTTINPNQLMFFQKTPDPEIYKALRANGRTIFLTLDEKGLRPQTGTLFGLSGKTDSGLDNRNNINFFSIQNIEKR